MSVYLGGPSGEPILIADAPDADWDLTPPEITPLSDLGVVNVDCARRSGLCALSISLIQNNPMDTNYGAVASVPVLQIQPGFYPVAEHDTTCVAYGIGFRVWADGLITLEYVPDYIWDHIGGYTFQVTATYMLGPDEPVFPITRASMTP